MSSLLIYFRHIRIFGLASPEVVLTLGLAFLLTSRQFENRPPNDDVEYFGTFVKKLSALVMIAIGVHYLFGVNTQLNYWLGLSCPPDFNSTTGIFPCNMTNAVEKSRLGGYRFYQELDL